MKGPLDRTKVVLRHLPPTISRSAIIEHVDSRFFGRYRCLSSRQGRSSQKLPSYSRAYIDLNKPEDVIEFAEFFNGHVFVNERGTQFKTLVEYAPSQCVPKQWSKKDGHEGTIFKDPEYLEFLEFLAKPIKNLPSAEIQLERKEAERAGTPKDIPVVTPLMDYVRQKRAAKIGTQRMSSNGKPTRRVTGMLSKSSGSGSSKRGSEKRTCTPMYVLRNSSKGAIGKDKLTNILVPKQNDQQLSNKSVSLAAASGIDALDEESGGSRLAETGKRKILLFKGKEKEIPIVSGTPTLQQTAASSAKNSRCSTAFQQNQQRETSGRIIRSILLNGDSRQNQSAFECQSELQIHTPNQDRDKRPPRPRSLKWFQKDSSGAARDKVVGNDLQGIRTEKLERRTRNKDRPDRGVRTLVRRSNGSHSTDGSFRSSTSQAFQAMDSAEVSYWRGGRRGSPQDVKDADGSSLLENKLLKRGGSSSHGSHEKQVWVQKSGSGS